METGTNAFIIIVVCLIASSNTVWIFDAQKQTVYNNDTLESTDYKVCYSCKQENGLTRSPTRFGCRCDADCYQYGDCCPELISGIQYDEDDLRDRWTCSLLMEENYIYMIGDCPAYYTKQDIIDKCTKKVHQYAYVLDLPVISATTNITYVNLYCAICNDDLDLVSLNITVSCNMDANQTVQVFQDLDLFEYRRGLQTWVKEIPGEDRPMECTFKPSPPWKTDKYIGMYGGRKCIAGMVSKCESTQQSNPNDIRLCGMYAMYVQERVSGKRYKNIHCSRCSGQLLGRIGNHDCFLARFRMKQYEKYPYPVSFSFLFDFRSIERIEQSEKCSVGQVYEYIRKSCVPVQCRADFEMVEGGQCVRKLPNSTLEKDCTRIPVSSDKYKLLDNGSAVVVTGPAGNILYGPGDYELSPSTNNHNSTVILICSTAQLGKVYYELSPEQGYLSVFCLSISILCLFFHILLYVLVPTWRNVPGKSLFSLAFSLLMAQLLYLTGNPQYSHRIVCQVFGILIHFFYLATFFWMNAMSFDIFRTFTSNTHRTDSLRTAFRKYCLYAWGCPLVIVTTSLSLDYIPKVPASFRPRYGQFLCWFNSSQALICLFIIPVGMIILANTVFFTVTVCAIRSQNKDAKYAQARSETVRVLDNSDQVTRRIQKSDKVKLLLYIKLAILMGMTWIFAFVATLSDVPSLWYPFVILNGSQGALIFASFDLKRKVLQNLMDICRKKQKRKTSHGTSATSRVTSSTRTSNTIAPSFPNAAIQDSK